MTIVSDADIDSFHEHGYVKLDGVVPREKCEAVIDAIWDRLGADPDDPETWYTTPKGMDQQWPSRTDGMVELSHHQALWDTRQDPSAYQAFAELWGEEALWVNIDRCNMTPPRHADYPEMDNSFLHWDVDLSDGRPLDTSGTDLPYGIQAVLFLDEVTEDQGTFQCVPSVYRNLDAWYETHDREDMTEDAYEEETVRVPGGAGDLVVWDSRLPHGNGSNTGDEPRFAQYVKMAPEEFSDREARSRRIDAWRECRTFGDDPSDWEPRNLDPAELTSLGEKLLGLDPWPDWLAAE